MRRPLPSDFLAAFFAPELRAWRGEAPLGKVFWLYGVCVSATFVVFYALAIDQDRLATQQLMLWCFAGYTIWILVSVWRCAATARSFWGLVARWLTVAWAGNAALLVAFLQFDLLVRYLGR